VHYNAECRAVRGNVQPTSRLSSKEACRQAVR
jgi:hypothetical protein